MGDGALRCVRPPWKMLGWLFHHMGRKRVPVSYGSNRKRVAECSCWRTDSTKFKLMFRPGSVISGYYRPTCSGWTPTWPIITLYSKDNLKSLRRLCKSCQPSSCNICVTTHCDFIFLLILFKISALYKISPIECSTYVYCRKRIGGHLEIF